MPIFTVLPRSSDDDAGDAPAILRGIVREPVNVVAVILGRPSRVEQIIEATVGRAEAAPNLRRVVHAPDPDVLDADQLTEMRGDMERTTVAFWGLDDHVAARLKSGHARRRLKVEMAFTIAEMAGVDS